MGNICKTENGMGNFFEKNSGLEKKDSAADAEKNRENARSCRQKCSMLQGLQAGYTQCFDICCRLLRRLCLLFSLSEFYIRSFAGQRKGCGFAKTY